MIEGLLQPVHLLVLLFIFVVCFGGPIGFAVYLVWSLRSIQQSLEKIAESLQTKS